MLPPHLTKTYGVHTPLTDFEAVSCKEARCPAYERGWQTKLLVGRNDDFGDRAAYDIRHSGMSFREEIQADGFTVFTFTPGQICFRGRAGQHRQRKPGARELYVVRDGRTGRVVQHTSPNFWVEDFALHQRTLADAQQRG